MRAAPAARTVTCRELVSVRVSVRVDLARMSVRREACDRGRQSARTSALESGGSSRLQRGRNVNRGVTRSGTIVPPGVQRSNAQAFLHVRCAMRRDERTGRGKAFQVRERQNAGKMPIHSSAIRRNVPDDVPGIRFWSGFPWMSFLDGGPRMAYH